jgi:cadmium resistance protein CadD (predicted permease)
MVGGLPADLGIAAAAFIGTNIDDTLVITAMMASSPPGRARRIALGQVVGFVVLVAASAGTALALFEFSPRVVGLLGFIPLALGLRGLILLRRSDRRSAVDRRAVGKGVVAATLITVASGGDNLAVYIPLFRDGGTTNHLAVGSVFLVGEVLLTLLVLQIGRHPRLRGVMARIGAPAVPILYCIIGGLVLVQAGTFG